VAFNLTALSFKKIELSFQVVASPQNEIKHHAGHDKSGIGSQNGREHPKLNKKHYVRGGESETKSKNGKVLKKHA